MSCNAPSCLSDLVFGMRNCGTCGNAITSTKCTFSTSISMNPSLTLSATLPMMAHVGVSGAPLSLYSFSTTKNPSQKPLRIGVRPLDTLLGLLEFFLLLLSPCHLLTCAASGVSIFMVLSSFTASSLSFF